MRTIKFRVWDGKYMDYDVWVNSCGAFGEPEKKYNTPNIEISSYPNKSIIMQFTGLYDKNGKEIYEGDILSKMWKVEVYKDENTNAFMVKIHTHSEVNKPRTLYKYLKERKRAKTEDTDCVIIGNIYENTELLNN